MEKKLRIAGFTVTVIIAIIILKLGNDYFLSHFDTGGKPGDNPILIYSDQIGFSLLALSPIILKKYKLSLLLIGLAAVCYLAIFLTSSPNNWHS